MSSDHDTVRNAGGIRARIGGFLLVVFTLFLSSEAHAGKPEVIALADKAWNYELRTTMLGRDLSVPVTINGKALTGASLCVIGERPEALTQEVLDTFRDLYAHVFHTVLPMRYAGRTAKDCGAGRYVILRLYSGFPSDRALSEDLGWMNRLYDLGLPSGRYFTVTSPGMGQTFFGRLGTATHIMVTQPHGTPLGIERAFYRSILIEELFQSFTFGMDVLVFNRRAGFMSKLQELPLNIHRLPWMSRAFMRALLSSNPAGLCDFDIFMMHAVAETRLERTNDPRFIKYIEADYDRLWEMTEDTLSNPQFAGILDRKCHPPTGPVPRP